MEWVGNIYNGFDLEGGTGRRNGLVEEIGELKNGVRKIGSLGDYGLVIAYLGFKTNYLDCGLVH